MSQKHIQVTFQNQNKLIKKNYILQNETEA